MSPEKKATIAAFGKAVARALAAAREEKGITQSELADMTGISQSQLSKQLRGLRAINLDEIRLICNALGISMASIFQKADDSLVPGNVTHLSDVRSNKQSARAATHDGTVTDWDDTIPHAAKNGIDENEERLRRGEDPID